MIIDFVIFIVAMAALVFGANAIVKESERLALHFHIAPFIIGATLIAFGTSLPEMAASMAASYAHKSDMAVANVVGSVIFNITLVLGVVLFLSKDNNPSRDLFSKDSAWVVLPVLIFILMLQDKTIGRFDGILFLLIMAAYITYLILSAKKELVAEIDTEIEKEPFLWSKTLFWLFIGFVFVIEGAEYVIQSSSHIASSFGISQWVIGLFLISLGTSLPELVVSVVAIKKGNADMSIGNIIGSNVANFSMVLGASSIVHPLHIDIHEASYDIMVMVAASIALLFILANRMYNKSGAIILLTILLLFIQNNIVHL
jgi:cation:H+ antiporter